MKRLVRFLFIALICGAGIYYGEPLVMGYLAGQHGGGPGGGPMGMGPSPVSVATVIEKDAKEWSEFPGRLMAVDTAEIKPRVTGTIEKVHFDDGQMVKQGDPLFTIDRKPYAAEVERAKGMLSSAKATLANATIDFERSKSLVKQHVISQREYDTRKAALNTAQGAVNAASGDLAVAQVNLDYAEVRAPLSGKIGQAEFTEGNTVSAGLQAPTLTTIVALSPLYVVFDVDEHNFLQHIQNVPADRQRDIPIQFGLANQTDTPYKAVINSFDNQLNIASGTIRVRAIYPNADANLVPGLYAHVRMGTAVAVPTILVNDSAIGTDQSKKFVYVMGKNNMPEYREVTLGQTVDGLRVIKTGLKAGDSIIVNGLMRVMPGAPVAPEKVDMITLAPVKK